jgi:hypothetical protein
MERDEGDAERVLGGLTAVESAADATVDSEVVEEVRRADAARRGRGAEALEFGLGPLPAGLFAVLCALLIRAARAFREGRRLDGLGASGPDLAGGEVELIGVVVGSITTSNFHSRLYSRWKTEPASNCLSK